MKKKKGRKKEFWEERGLDEKGNDGQGRKEEDGGVSLEGSG